MRIFRVMLAILALGLTTAVWADQRVVNSPGDGYLNLRTGPGSGFAIIGPMPHGSIVEVLENAGGWVRVQHESGAVGWAFQKYLSPIAAGPQYRRVIWTSDGYLNMRTGPGTRYDIIMPMYTGAWVEMLEVAGSWARVRHESGAVGWASAKYLGK